MPKYFCEYCGIYLTHSSPLGRYQHSHGRKHINNKIEYYSQFLYEFQQNAYKNLLNLTARYLRKPLVIKNKKENNDNIENKENLENKEKEKQENLENKENNNETQKEEKNNNIEDNNDDPNDIIIKDITEK